MKKEESNLNVLNSIKNEMEIIHFHCHFITEFTFFLNAVKHFNSKNYTNIDWTKVQAFFINLPFMEQTELFHPKLYPKEKLYTCNIDLEEFIFSNENIEKFNLAPYCFRIDDFKN